MQAAGWRVDGSGCRDTLVDTLVQGLGDAAVPERLERVDVEVVEGTRRFVVVVHLVEAFVEPGQMHCSMPGSRCKVTGVPHSQENAPP